MRLAVILGLSLLTSSCFGINVDPSSRGTESFQIRMLLNNLDSLSSAARIAANDMLTFYNGNQPGGTPGVFDIPGWFWWMGGTGWEVHPIYLLDKLTKTGFNSILVADRRHAI